MSHYVQTWIICITTALSAAAGILIFAAALVGSIR